MPRTPRGKFIAPERPDIVAHKLRSIGRQVLEDVYSDLPRDATWHDMPEIVLHQVEGPLSEYQRDPHIAEAVVLIVDWQHTSHDWAVRELERFFKEQSDRRGRIRG